MISDLIQLVYVWPCGGEPEHVQLLDMAYTERKGSARLRYEVDNRLASMLQTGAL